MKYIQFSKRVVISLLLFTSLFVFSACSQNIDTSGTPASPIPASVVPANPVPSSGESTSNETSGGGSIQPSSDPSAEENQAGGVTSSAEKYKIEVYTEAPNKNSSIKIQYPSFSGNEMEALNALVYDKVQGFAKIDTSFFSIDAGLTIDYQTTVTLQNSKVVSIVFWGSSYMEESAYPMNYLIPLNVDLQTMEEITLKDLYTTNADFEKVFFDTSIFPENPITSYDKDSFPEMLNLQSPEYQTVDPFSIADNISCFLKPDGIVLSMPAVHATGSDHFEAQLKYSDIQQFYLAGQNYWED